MSGMNFRHNSTHLVVWISGLFSFFVVCLCYSCLYNSDIVGVTCFQGMKFDLRGMLLLHSILHPGRTLIISQKSHILNIQIYFMWPFYYLRKESEKPHRVEVLPKKCKFFPYHLSYLLIYTCICFSGMSQISKSCLSTPSQIPFMSMKSGSSHQEMSGNISRAAWGLLMFLYQQ